MPSTQRHTTNYGDGTTRHPAATVRLRSSGSADDPSVLQLENVNAAGTVGTRYLWPDTNNRLRFGTTYPTDQDGSGIDIEERQTHYVTESLGQGVDISARPFWSYEGASGGTCSLVRGSVVALGAIRVPSGQTLTIGLTSPAGTVVTLNRTSTIAAGGRVSLGTFANTSLNTGQVVRLSVTQDTNGTLTGGLALQMSYAPRP